MKNLQIAIDGPVAAGKGTVSQSVAQKLQLLYIDTGATYRASALIAEKANLDLSDEESISSELKKHQIELRTPSPVEQDGRLTTVFLDGIDVSWEIRAENIGQKSSIIAQYPKVREHLIALQQQIARDRDVIAEGRDITHTVLPNAQLKIYLDAEPSHRAERRLLQLQKKGVDATLEEILSELQKRDARDVEKNLKKLPGVWYIDTTNLSIEEVVDLIVTRAQEVLAQISA